MENGILPVGALSIVPVYSPRIFVVIIPPPSIRDPLAGIYTKPLNDLDDGALIARLRVVFLNTMHIFDPNVAAEFGIAEAVIIQHFQFWIANNKRNGRNENDGRTWTYNTTKALAETFPYLSEKQIWLAIDRLVEKGVLMKGNYNKTQYDRTTWYAFTLESFWIRPEGNFHFPRVENPAPASVEPIPDSPTDTLTNSGTDTPAADAPGDKKPDPIKKTASRKKTPGAENDKDWQRWVDRYEDHVKDRNGGTGHRWDGAQLGPQGLKGIRAHLVKISTKLDGKSDDDCGYGAWCYILDNWELLREWLQGQFDLTVILKKITDILNSLRNATNTNRGANSNGFKPGTSEARVQALRDY